MDSVYGVAAPFEGTLRRPNSRATLRFPPNSATKRPPGRSDDAMLRTTAFGILHPVKRGVGERRIERSGKSKSSPRRRA